MTEKKYTLYKSTTCTRCPLAEGTMNRSGVDFETIVLDAPGNEALLEAFREESLERGFKLEMPIVRTPDDYILSNLATISQHFRELVKS